MKHKKRESVQMNTSIQKICDKYGITVQTFSNMLMDIAEVCLTEKIKTKNLEDVDPAFPKIDSKNVFLRSAAQTDTNVSFRFACLWKALFDGECDIDHFCKEKYWVARDKLLRSKQAVNRTLSKLFIDEMQLRQLLNIGTVWADTVEKSIR
jgi:hypothetical protein